MWLLRYISIILKPFDRFQKFGVCKIFLFLKQVSYAHQVCIYLIKNSVNSNIVKYNYNLK